MKKLCFLRLLFCITESKFPPHTNLNLLQTMTHEELQYRAGFDLASFFAALDSFTEAMEYLRKYDRKKSVRKAAIDLMFARVAEIGGYALSRLENEKDDQDSFRESFLDSAQFTARNLLHQYAKISAYQIPVDPAIIEEAQSIL